ncbi:MAG: hypothetical protein ASARMPREDX12_005252 [Alectoria sarmentosa]|nr:MAG: hypothetical protein ASARMPREDX12_005252 [Alectoria sarmentosa]
MHLPRHHSSLALLLDYDHLDTDRTTAHPITSFDKGLKLTGQAAARIKNSPNQPCISQLQKADVKKGVGQSAKWEVTTINVPHPEPGQILCKINYSGVCGTDRSFFHDDLAALSQEMEQSVKGMSSHERAGVVVAVADDVKELWKDGDRVGIFVDYQCAARLISGVTVPGAFQEYCLTGAQYATLIPDGVKDEEAGSILCGGVTAYTACRRPQVRAGSWIVLVGAGAQGVIVFAISKQSYATAPFLLRPGGTVVAVDVPTDPSLMARAPPGFLIDQRLKIVGTKAGTLKEFDEALDYAARRLVKPILTHGTLHDIDENFERIGSGRLAAGAVTKISA